MEARIQELVDAASRNDCEDDLAHSESDSWVTNKQNLQAINRDKELESVSDEWQKWEAREEHLLKQITTLEKLAIMSSSKPVPRMMP